MQAGAHPSPAAVLIAEVAGPDDMKSARSTSLNQVQRIHGPYSMAAGVAAYEKHLDLHQQPTDPREG